MTIQKWTVALTNVKTGPIATSFVGSNQDEARASCLGCPQLGDHDTPTKCYAWLGTGRRGANMVWHHSQKDPSLKAAFLRAPDKRAVRMGAIGDPGRVDPITLFSEAAFARNHGAAVLAYTHHWREFREADYKRLFMASCDDWQGARAAIEAGWCPTVIVPAGGPKVVHTSTGHTFLRCPAETAKLTGGRVTCGDCRLCDPNHLRTTRWAGIMFEFHGSRAPWTPARRAAFEARRLPVVSNGKAAK